LNAEQREYRSALVFWIGEFGYSSPYSKMQREKEEKDRLEKKALPDDRPTYRLGMGHAFAIVGASANQQYKAYKKNLARHNYAIFEARLRIDEKEAEEVHVYLKEQFARIPDESEIRVKDLESALESVLKGGLCFSSHRVWPKKVTDEERHNPPVRPDEERHQFGIDTWTLTM
jgi:hypothetical protein